MAYRIMMQGTTGREICKDMHLLFQSENLMFKDRKLNIGPAIRKQAFSRGNIYCQVR